MLSCFNVPKVGDRTVPEQPLSCLTDADAAPPLGQRGLPRTVDGLEVSQPCCQRHESCAFPCWRDLRWTGEPQTQTPEDTEIAPFSGLSPPKLRGHEHRVSWLLFSPPKPPPQWLLFFPKHGLSVGVRSKCMLSCLVHGHGPPFKEEGLVPVPVAGAGGTLRASVLIKSGLGQEESFCLVDSCSRDGLGEE